MNEADKNNLQENDGELYGFDTVKPEDEPKAADTVTDGTYARQKHDIIQDAAPQNPPVNNPEPQKNWSSDDENGFKFYSAGPSDYGYKQPATPKKTKTGVSVAIVIIAVVLAAVIGAVGGITAFTYLQEDEPTVVLPENNGEQTKVNINIDETAENIVEAVATKVTPSVIGIRTTTSVKNFFGGSSDATGEGSGVVYTQDGYIITNYHVIEDAVTNKSNSKIEVFIDTADSESYEAKVVGYNISADLAVIKINVSNLTPIEIGDSEELKIGQYVITVGNPGGLEFMDSVTYGVVSGLNRVVSSDSEVELIQTDAAINPGNSGGALVDAKGRLVGINSSKIVAQEYEGMGFAIPSKTAIEICNNIISKEFAPDPYIGLTISEKYTAEILDFYGYPNGAVILSVSEGSPADDAGIRKGDIITEYRGSKITEFDVLTQLMNESEPGDKVTIKFYRAGRYYSTTLTVGSNNQVD